MPSSPDADEVCTRIERMKTLCDQLDTLKSDQRRYNELIDRIRQEADAFRRSLNTHDPKP